LLQGAGEELLGESMETDAGGNKKLPAIGDFIRCKVEGKCLALQAASSRRFV